MCCNGNSVDCLICTSFPVSLCKSIFSNNPKIPKGTHGFLSACQRSYRTRFLEQDVLFVKGVTAHEAYVLESIRQIGGGGRYGPGHVLGGVGPRIPGRTPATPGKTK